MDEVRISIKNNLPNISDDILERTLLLLEELGVSTLQDLELVEEQDLIPVLKKIQARLLIREWRKKEQETVEPEIVTSFSLVPVASTSTAANVVTLPPTPSEDMGPTSIFNPQNYKVSWECMPAELLRCLSENKRPKPSLRNNMVRIICDDIYRRTKKPGRKILSVIAENIVQRHPLSFSDEISKDLNGTSHLSLLKQFEVRFDNLNRSSAINVLKRSSENENNNSKKIKSSDCYGCVNYQPDLPLTETAQTQIEKCEKMKIAAVSFPDELTKEYKQLLKETYYTIRKDINSGKHLDFLMTQWPLLFTKEGFLDHFNELVGIDIETKLSLAISKIGFNIIEYFLSAPKIKCTSSEKFKSLIKDLKSCTIKKEDFYTWQALISFIMTYFEDKVEMLFIVVDIASTAGEVEMNIPHTPCLICYGDSLQNASLFMLAVDSRIVMQNIKTFQDGFSLLFAAFYCLNIEYPSAAATTLEFIQRCFLDINPLKGSKAEPSQRKKNIHQKIVSFKKKISDFEWNL